MTGLGLHSGSCVTWTPSRLPGLWGWWQSADALNSVGPNVRATLGQTIRRVLDRSGNGRHLDQATGTMQPTLAYFNGADPTDGYGIAFDGVDDVLQPAVNLVRSNMAMTAFVVVRLLPVIGNYESIYDVGDSWQNTGAATFNRPSAGTGSRFRLTATDGFINQLQSFYSPVSAFSLGIIAEHGPNFDSIGLVINGVVQSAVATTGTPTGNNPGSTHSLRVGSSPFGDTLHGVIKEIGIYNRALSAPEKARLVQYVERRHR